MEIKALNVIRIIVVMFGFLYAQNAISQEKQEPKIVNEDMFKKAMQANVSRIFATNPYGNVDSVKYEGFHAILKICNGKVSRIEYPNWINHSVTRMSEFALKDINERIENGEFKLENIEQIIISTIIEWIHFETNEPQLYKALSKILPNLGYSSSTYVLTPFVLSKGNTIIN